jgi:hypothetical protein
VPYVNVGTSIAGIRIPTKKALREAVKQSPADVSFDGTSPLGPQFNGRATEIPEGLILTVCGPDPYERRNWWATVTRTGNQITVK